MPLSRVRYLKDLAILRSFDKSVLCVTNNKDLEAEMACLAILEQSTITRYLVNIVRAFVYVRMHFVYTKFVFKKSSARAQLLQQEMHQQTINSINKNNNNNNNTNKNNTNSNNNNFTVRNNRKRKRN